LICFAAAYATTAKYGLMLDDILIRNDSPFELTNIRLDVVMGNTKGTFHPDLMQRKTLKPGETYMFENVTSVTGSTLTQSAATLTCDQQQTPAVRTVVEVR
jgi:hypothetical protein